MTVAELDRLDNLLRCLLVDHAGEALGAPVASVRSHVARIAGRKRARERRA